MKLIEAPQAIPMEDMSKNKKMIFLGGSIEMGKAEDWQKVFAESFSDDENIVILNPRRRDWDASWAQDPTPGTKFHEQVSWELLSQELSDIIVYNFLPDTTSPITLLELGLFAQHWGNVVVCCPKEYFRYGNVKIVCDRNDVPCVSTMAELVKLVKEKIKEG